MTSVRLAAAEILLAIERGRTTLGAELERPREALPDRRDRALLGELTTGTVRWRAELDALIASASQRAVALIDPPARTVLRLGVYQLRHLARIPPHAIVHESVEVVRALGAPRAAGFVNAVLRSVLRRGQSLALPPRPSGGANLNAQIAYLSITLSHPAWIVRRWLDRYGFDQTERWCQFNNQSPVVTIRPAGTASTADLLARFADEAIEATPAVFAGGAIELPPGSLGRVSGGLRARFDVQDEGSQLVAELAGGRQGEHVLDVCAAPGGKAIVMAGRMGLPDSAGSWLVAADVRPARVALLSQSLRRAGLACPVLALDASGPLPFDSVFDRVVVDAPCSGLGTLRRDPDLKWSRVPEDIPRLAAGALCILSNAAVTVKAGGRLVYATCSSEPEENIAVVEQFLAQNGHFRLEPLEPHGLPSTNASAVIAPPGVLETTPPQHGLDAFFAAVMVRREST